MALQWPVLLALHTQNTCVNQKRVYCRPHKCSPKAQANVLTQPANVLNATNTAIGRTYIHTAHKICSQPDTLEAEIERAKQILINNGFSNSDFDKDFIKFRHHFPLHINNWTKASLTSYIMLYNQMTQSHKTDESIMRNYTLKCQVHTRR